MPNARITRPPSTDTSAVPLIYQPSPIENFGERARRLFNKRDVAAASNDNIIMAVAAIPATRYQPPRTEACIYATIYIKLKTTLEFIFVSGWGEFILQ